MKEFLDEKENIINPAGIVVNRELGCLCGTRTGTRTGSSASTCPRSRA